VHNDEKEELTIFAVNRNLNEALELQADVYGFEGYTFAEHLTMHHQNLKAVNSAKGEVVSPQVQSGGRLEGAELSAVLPAASWNVIRLVKGK
jgi:alpha-N-arabinofuranosidase